MLSMNWRAGILLLLFAAGSPHAEPMPPVAASEAEQQRLVAISGSLRCLVCRGEPLHDSQARLAEDLRREIRGMIREGKNDREIRDALLARYSDFLQYEPSGKADRLWWALAVLLLFAAAGGLLFYLSRRNGRSGFRVRPY
jgi:cytochrome c-type biogenesis protein CcmH